MKGSLRGLLFLNYIWLFIVAILIILAIIPAIPGAVLVELPSSDEWKTTITNDTVVMTGNVSIHNGGVFPLNDFLFAVILYDDNGSSLASFRANRTDLLPGLWVDVPLTLFIDKSLIRSSVLEGLISSEVTFGNLVFFNTNYLFDFQIQVGYRGKTTIGPLIEDFELDLNETSVVKNGTVYQLTVPYSFNSSRALQGSNLSISGTVSNDTTLLGTIETNATLGGFVESQLLMQLSEEAYDHLSTSPDHLVFEVRVTLWDVTWEITREHDWAPVSAGGG